MGVARTSESLILGRFGLVNPQRSGVAVGLEKKLEKG